jgi:hypothetical protein
MKSIRFMAIFTATCLALTISPSAHAKAKPKAFNGKTCTIVGTSKSDKLTGTSKADVICGLGGKDTINGQGGNDTIDGGAGNDLLSGGAGNDLIDGGAGNDIVNGENGNDVLTGDAGNDSLNGGSGNDSLQGETGADIFAGGAGKDTVTYTEKIVDLTLDIDGKADDGIAGEKDNIKTDVENVIGGSGNDTITGSSGANTISGGSGRDNISGESGNDIIEGEAGDDTLNGGAGRDVSVGGVGLNTCSVEANETRDHTCQLLSNLQYLFKRISGSVTGWNGTWDGCAVKVQNFVYQQEVFYIAMQSNGTFEFDAPPMETALVTVGESQGNMFGHNCAVPFIVQLGDEWRTTRIDSDKVLNGALPPHQVVSFSAKNSRGDTLPGAMIELQSSCLKFDGSAAPTDIWSAGLRPCPVTHNTARQLTTDSSGNLTINALTGSSYTARSTVAVGGYTFRSNILQFTVGDGTPLDLIYN